MCVCTRWGVFPLRGKVLNVRDAAAKKLLANAELANLMSALGLDPAASYDDGGGGKLRYGQLMLMTDQDEDGSHIKGLVISMLHHFWPELLRRPFVQDTS